MTASTARWPGAFAFAFLCWCAVTGGVWGLTESPASSIACAMATAMLIALFYFFLFIPFIAVGAVITYAVSRCLPPPTTTLQVIAIWAIPLVLFALASSFGVPHRYCPMP